MRFTLARTSRALSIWLAASPPVAAQIDYRNLDGHLPTRVTDAYPVERYAFEISLPYRVSWGNGAGQVVSPHVEYGIGRNVMIGIGADLVTRRGRGFADETRLSAGALWNTRRETPSAPALSLGLEIELPVGGDGDESSLAGTVSVLATRSIGRTRLHANGSATMTRAAPTTGRSAVGWWGGVAVDYTLFRSSTLLVAEAVAERSGRGEPVSGAVGLGLRRQLAPTIVILAGYSRSLGDAGRSEVRLGLSHTFAIARLLPAGPR